MFHYRRGKEVTGGEREVLRSTRGCIVFFLFFD